MHTIIFLGPDRVGKTTLLGKTESMLTQAGFKVATLHFSGIRPHHHSPVDQFRNAFLELKPPTIDYLLIDRFVSDTLFYEPIRMQMPRIDNIYSQEAESMIIDISDRVDVAVISKPWDQDIIDRHVYELRNTNPTCTTYWVNSQLEIRKTEHEKYYEHTRNFFDSISLINPGHVHYSSSADDSISSVFQAFPRIVLGES
jgi:hypothetical protein